MDGWMDSALNILIHHFLTESFINSWRSKTDRLSAAVAQGLWGVCVCVCVECDTGIWSPGEFGGGCMFLQLTRPPIFTWKTREHTHTHTHAASGHSLWSTNNNRFLFLELQPVLHQTQPVTHFLRRRNPRDTQIHQRLHTHTHPFWSKERCSPPIM